MQAATSSTSDVALIAIPANDHVEVIADRRTDPTEQGGRRKTAAKPAKILAEGDAAPMPRPTKKELKAAQERADAASRINTMTQDNMDAVKQVVTDKLTTLAGGKAVIPLPDGSLAQVEVIEDRREAAPKGLIARVGEAIDHLLHPENYVPVEGQPAPAPADVPRETTPAPAPADVPRETTPAPAPADAAPAPTQAAPAPATGKTPAIGPMRGLRERLKQGAYQKMPNGQPANGDEVATALGNLEPLEVVKALMIAFDHTANIYGHLNVGQQSMNYRNKFRGALKRGELGMGVLREAVEVILEQRPAPAPAQTPAAPAPEAAPAPQADTPAPVQVQAQDGEPVANPAKVDDPSTANARSEASKKANASRTPEQRSEASKKAAATRKAKQGDPRKAQGK
jgi:hypothetical protein